MLLFLCYSTDKQNQLLICISPPKIGEIIIFINKIID